MCPGWDFFCTPDRYFKSMPCFGSPCTNPVSNFPARSHARKISMQAQRTSPLLWSHFATAGTSRTGSFCIFPCNFRLGLNTFKMQFKVRLRLFLKIGNKTTETILLSKSNMLFHVHLLPAMLDAHFQKRTNSQTREAWTALGILEKEFQTFLHRGN